MKTIVVTSQSEWDALPKAFSELTVVEIRSNTALTIKSNPENSSAELRENSRAVLLGNSRAVLRENSSAELRENSRAVLWGNSRAELWGNSISYAYNIDVSVTLYMFAVCFLLAKAKVIKKSKTCHVITPKSKPGNNGWLENHAIKPTKNVVLFKRVSKDFKTQEGTTNETLWSVGSMVECKDWNPKEKECGKGKFHACAKPYLADEFRSNKGDKYIAIKIDKADLYSWSKPAYPHKIAFRKGKVLYECDRYGERVKP